MFRATTTTALALGLLFASGAVSADRDDHRGLRFESKLEGFNLRGEPVITDAKGKAKFRIIDDDSAVKYEVDVKGLENTWMAHIHISPTPVEVTDPAGPIAFWFLPSTPPAAPPTGVSVAEKFKGTLNAGLIMSNGQLVGVLAPDPGSPETTGVRGLINAMLEGRASIVVHTNAFGDPAFSLGGAGNSPPGELRGTIVAD